LRLCKAYYTGRDGTNHKSKRWYVEFRDHRDKVHRVRAFEDKRASQAFADKLQQLVSCHISGAGPDPELTRWLEMLPNRILERFGRLGLLDANRVASTKPLRDHLDDYEKSLRDSGATAEYVQKTVNRVRAVLDGVAVTFLSELSASAVMGVLARMREKGRRKAGSDQKTESKGLGAKSSNHYLAAVKGFGNWLVKDRRATENPLAHLSGLNAKADRRHVRRALDLDELRRLLAAARSGPGRCEMDGESRHWLYRLALETGLRSNELRSLTRASFDSDATQPTVKIDAANAKNRKAATLPLRSETAAELRALLGAKLPTVPVFHMPRPEKVVMMMRGDLDAAGIPYADETGRVADFHSLRVTFATMLLRSGVDVRTAKELMRHATINMTADVYACTFRESLDNAVRKLPSLAGCGLEQLRATGTDENVLPECLPFSCAQPLNSVRDGATPTPMGGDPQPMKKTGTYDAPVGNAAHENAGCLQPALSPPRGFEPLSPA